ncbi:MAG: SRPBCC domain-containing protein [Chloroflexi bacterium]|nr:SRPBCC domain-containing protein [Chloroflexota bacterium]
MTREFTVEAIISARPLTIFAAWLDGKSHTNMTGGEATGEPVVGSEFTAWDDYISGKNLALEPAKRILQSWRTSQFTDDHEDSVIEVTLTPHGEESTAVTLKHSNVPDDQADGYKSGWVDHYFEPMQAYFGGVQG